jgi:predicted P-loop ATPase
VGALHQSFLKHVLTKSSVQTRSPYGSTTERLRRYATFIATDNNFYLLTITVSFL